MKQVITLLSQRFTPNTGMNSSQDQWENTIIFFEIMFSEALQNFVKLCI